MAVPEQTPYIEHTGNGVTTSFSLGFQCESKDHLIVLVDEIEPPIATWSLTGGNVVFTTAPAAGKKITLQRNTPFNRNAEYQSFNNSFRPQTVNIDFDRIWWKLQELGVADWLMKLYVDRLHQQQEQKINDLKSYVDDRDDELRAYLMEEIRKQGVALDQLDEYYNYLMQRLAQIAVDKGWDASFVVDASGQTQQRLNTGLESIADLIAINSPANNSRIYVKSFNSGLDIGGDYFLFKKGSTLTPDGGRVFADPLDTGRWIRLNRDIKFEQFGAVGDGLYDDSDAIIATFASPHTKRNGAFYTDVTCERATYRVTKTLGKCAGSLSGVGGGFRYAQLPTKFLVDTTEKITVFAADSQIVAENIWFTGKKTTSSIKNDLFDRTQFYMCRFTNCAFQWFDTLFKIAGVYLNFDHCQFTENVVCLDIYNLADTTTSTMMQLMNCRFTYNTTGVQIVDKGGTAAQESFVNMLVVGTGFELGSNGIIADRQVYEMTLQNCWFEKLTNISVKATSSQVVEINTRWESDAAAPIKSAAWTVIKGTSASSFPELSLGLLKGTLGGQQTVRVANNLELASKYLGGASANVNENGYEFSQAFSNDQGSSVSGLRFNRRAVGGAGQHSGSDIVFYTGRMTSAGTSKVDRWRLDFDGSFKPIGDAVYNIGSTTERVNASYVKTRMYSATVGDFAGTGSPEGVVAAGVGSTYRRTDGTAGACFYVKETGVGATGWVAK